MKEKADNWNWEKGNWGYVDEFYPAPSPEEEAAEYPYFNDWLDNDQQMGIDKRGPTFEEAGIEMMPVYRELGNTGKMVLVDRARCYEGWFKEEIEDAETKVFDGLGWDGKPLWDDIGDRDDRGIVGSDASAKRQADLAVEFMLYTECQVILMTRMFTGDCFK